MLKQSCHIQMMLDKTVFGQGDSTAAMMIAEAHVAMQKSDASKLTRQAGGKVCS